MKKQSNVNRGKKARASGQRFELKVRKDLELEGWIVSKWQNNVSELFKQDIGEYVRKLISAKMGIFRSNQGGFPDFIIFKCIKLKVDESHWTIGKFCGPCKLYENIGIECKSRGYLDKEEKEKCEWLLDKKIFSKIFIAKKKKVGRKIEVEYKEFRE